MSGWRDSLANAGVVALIVGVAMSPFALAFLIGVLVGMML